MSRKFFLKRVSFEEKFKSRRPIEEWRIPDGFDMDTDPEELAEFDTEKAALAALKEEKCYAQFKKTMTRPVILWEVTYIEEWELDEDGEQSEICGQYFPEIEILSSELLPQEDEE